MRQEILRLEGLKARYFVAGQGKAVLILHGWGKGAESWQKVGDGLAQSFQVIIPDLPGFGKSDPPSTAWGIDDYVGWVLNFSQALKLSPFFIIAHSFGGRIAIKLASLYPQKLRGLVLIAPAGISRKKSFRQKLASAFAKIGKRVFSRPPFHIFENKVQKIVYKIAGTTDYLQAGPLRQTFKKIISENLRPYLKKIKTPTLIIWGKKDRITPLKDGYIIQKEIAQAQLEVLEGLGHNLHLVKPRLLTKIIQDKGVKG